MAAVWLRRATIVLIGVLMLLPLPQTAATGEPPAVPAPAAPGTAPAPPGPPPAP